MKVKKSVRIRILCIFFMFLVCMSFYTPVAADTTASSDTKAELDVLKGKTAGVMTGTPQDSIVQANVPDAQIQYFNTATDMALALQTGKIDFYVLSTVNFYNMAEKYPEFGYIKTPLATFDIGTIFPKTEKADEIRTKLNEYIAKLKESQELEKLQEYWLYPHDWETVEIPSSGENGTLQMATANTLVPFSFMLHEKNVGFDIAILAGFCKEYGYGLNIENTDFSGLLSGISTGKYDLAAGQIAWTKERAESVNYSDFYYTQEIVAIVNTKTTNAANIVRADTSGTDSSASSSDSEEQTNQTQGSLWDSIRKTLLEDNRWQSILKGFLVTLLITFAGFALANLLGALFCAMELSGAKVLKALSVVYSSLMQGLPIVVILMLLYYVVFARSAISNITVAIIGFGLVFGAYMAELFKESINSVEKGQWEASLAIGFTKSQTFRDIVLPQAIKTMLPGYFRNLISLMKGTAVVGYIAITDLTKVGDIIRSNTYEAIVPLVTIAIIYFAMAILLFIVMNCIQKKLKGSHKS